MDWNELYSYQPADDSKDLTKVFETGSVMVDHDEYQTVKETCYANYSKRPAPTSPKSSAHLLQIDRIRD